MHDDKQKSHSTLSYALICLIDLPTLLAIGVLLFNDHVLKATVPSWWTGKLSDLAGLYFFPYLLFALLGLLEAMLGLCSKGISYVGRRFSSPNPSVGQRQFPGQRFRSQDRAMAVALFSNALWFIALKATPASNAFAVALLETVTGRSRLSVVVDPTDLIALVMLPLAWLRWRMIVGRCDGLSPVRHMRLKRRMGFAVLIVASLATIATSPRRSPLSFGIVFDVAADAGDSNTWYASLATRRIEKCGRPQGAIPLFYGSCEVTQVDHGVEIYRSQDGGRTWTRYTSVGGYLWSDPHLPARLYVLNEQGLHRIEGGLERLLDVPFQPGEIELFNDGEYDEIGLLANAHPLVFDPVTADVLYLGDGERLLSSSDAGQSWRSLAPVGLPDRVTALAIALSAPQTLYATDGGNISRSDDGGQTWSPAIPVDKEAKIRALAVHPAAPEVVYAAGNGVFLSIDGGTSWQRVGDIGASQSIAISPANLNLIIVVGPEQIYSDVSAPDRGGGRAAFSDDGGQVWHIDGDLPGWKVAISPIEPHRMMLALGDQGVAMLERVHVLPTPTSSAHQGASSTPLVVYADALVRADSGTLYALSSDPPVLGRSDDSGQTWVSHSLVSLHADPPIALAARAAGPTGTASLVAAGHESIYYLAWQQDGVQVERMTIPASSGQSWFPRPLLVDPANPDGLLTTYAAGILRSEDGGETWTMHPFSLPNGIDASLPAPTVTEPSRPTSTLSTFSDRRETATVSFTVTQALVPIQRQTPTAFSAEPVVLAVSPSQPATLYALAVVRKENVQEHVVFRSEDGGSNWTPRAGLDSGISLAALAVDPADPEIVYGGGTGLYRSDDGGANWQPVYAEIEVRALAIVSGDPRLFYAITREGVAHSRDDGASWTLVCPAGLVNGPAEFVDIVPNPVGSVAAIFLARPTRIDVPQPSLGLCWDATVPRYDLREGWQSFKEGLPVFVELYGE